MKKTITFEVPDGKADQVADDLAVYYGWTEDDGDKWQFIAMKIKTRVLNDYKNCQMEKVQEAAITEAQQLFNANDII